MFEKKRIITLLAAAALVAACGGGGGSNDIGTGSTTGSNTGTGPDGGTSSNTGTPAGTNDTAGTTVPASDQQLRGYLEMVSNQVIYIRNDRSIYLPVTLTQYESNTGIYDIASGFKEGDTVNRTNCSAQGRCGIDPSATAPAAPLAVFGFRVNRFVQPSTEGQAVGNQKVVGRVAFDLTERLDSPALSGGAPEVMRFVINGVELTTDDKGELVSAQVLAGAEMHVEGQTAAGNAVRATVPVRPGTARLLPITEIPDHFGDTSSVVLLIDLENAFADAGTQLAGLEDIKGHFNMGVTLSSAQMVRPAGSGDSQNPPVERKELVGPEIRVNEQPVVRGGGISGNAYIRWYP